MSCSYAQAAGTKLPAAFGKDYGGRTLDDIAGTDEGLLYLDALLGRARAPWLKDALTTYLTHPTIARLVDLAIAARDS